MITLSENMENSNLKQKAVYHCPEFLTAQKSYSTDIKEYEKVLSEWFGCNVILLASGRSGLHLFLQEIGFHRYKNRFQIPAYLSRCVMNAITPSAFPVKITDDADGVLFYHQYGFVQRCKPKARVIVEDIAHSFFVSPHKGNREWAGDVAIFSLPKFFSMSGLAGGLIVPDDALAYKLSRAIDKWIEDPEDVRAWMRKILRRSYKPEPSESLYIDSAYELLLKLLRPDPNDLIGFPDNVSEIGAIGEKRKARIVFFRKYFGNSIFPKNFWNEDEPFLPFALPYFSDGNVEKLGEINKILNLNGIKSDIYQIDINRNIYNPDYQPCVLLPCHQHISLSDFENMCSIIMKTDL